ncbi:type II toxin-antitoxin system HicB family antitoxin [Lacticaseibacillus jixiensis]|uniref:type II toxin-antitoxin system HicB family antitoxin n=1 Tax=Lacticaseibacillus jixiensis TaxID=3231926 RepID=UPI0036F219C7
MTERDYADMMAAFAERQSRPSAHTNPWKNGEFDGYDFRQDRQITAQEVLTYPVIIHENNDEDGHYFTVFSPNIDGMVTQGDTRKEAEEQAVDAIATMLDGEPYPPVQDPAQWHLEPTESIAYITVDMARWLEDKAQARYAGAEDSQ